MTHPPLTTQLFLVVALMAEAKPLIQHFHLTKRKEGTLFPVFEAMGIALTVSGIGKSKSAAAVASLYTTLNPPPNSIWLNIGVAGHQTRGIGEVILAHQIVDQATDRSWYPSLPFTTRCPTDTVHTVDKPETLFASAAAYDMEGSGFYEIALRISSAELIHCIKVISDNKLSPVERFSGAYVEELVREGVPVLEQILATLHPLAQEVAVEPILDQLNPFFEKWHFTESQRHQMNRLYRRKQAIAPEIHWGTTHFTACRSSKELLHTLRQEIDKLPIRYTE